MSITEPAITEPELAGALKRRGMTELEVRDVIADIRDRREPEPPAVSSLAAALDRAERAEAALAAVTGHCHEQIAAYTESRSGETGTRYPGGAHVRALDILEIIGTEEESRDA